MLFVFKKKLDFSYALKILRKIVLCHLRNLSFNFTASCKILQSISLCTTFKQFLLIGNTRVISQHSLQTFQEKIQEVKNNPYQLLIKNHKLPMSLVKAPTTQVRI